MKLMDMNANNNHLDPSSPQKQPSSSSSTMHHQQFSAIACVHCRKAHRKCDRKLPSCSECVCRGFGESCTYAAPKKRGPKQSSLLIPSSPSTPMIVSTGALSSSSSPLSSSSMVSHAANIPTTTITATNVSIPSNNMSSSGSSSGSNSSNTNNNNGSTHQHPHHTNVNSGNRSSLTSSFFSSLSNTISNIRSKKRTMEQKVPSTGSPPPPSSQSLSIPSSSSKEELSSSLSNNYNHTMVDNQTMEDSLRPTTTSASHHANPPLIFVENTSNGINHVNSETDVMMNNNNNTDYSDCDDNEMSGGEESDDHAESALFRKAKQRKYSANTTARLNQQQQQQRQLDSVAPLSSNNNNNNNNNNMDNNMGGGGSVHYQQQSHASSTPSVSTTTAASANNDGGDYLSTPSSQQYHYHHQSSQYHRHHNNNRNDNNNHHYHSHPSHHNQVSLPSISMSQHYPMSQQSTQPPPPSSSHHHHHHHQNHSHRHQHHHHQQQPHHQHHSTPSNDSLSHIYNNYAQHSHQFNPSSHRQQQYEQIPLDIGQIELIHQLNFRLHVSALLEKYFGFLGSVFPLFDRASMEELVMTTFSSTNEILSSSVKEEQMITLLYATCAVTFQKMGKKTLALHSFQRCRELLSRHFDCVNVSFPVSASMALASYYLIGYGDFTKARFYYKSMKMFLKEATREQMKTTEYRALSDFSLYPHFLLSDSRLLDQIVSFSRVLTVMYTGTEIDTSMIDMRIPVENQIGLCLDLITNTMNRVMSGIDARIHDTAGGPTHLPSLRLTYEIVLLGLKLKIMSHDSQNIMHNSRMIADQISNLLGSPLIGNCSLLILEAVIYTSSLHLHDKNPAVELMKHDMNTLQLMISRYNLVSSKYAYIMTGLEDRLRQIQTPFPRHSSWATTTTVTPTTPRSDPSSAQSSLSATFSSNPSVNNDSTLPPIRSDFYGSRAQFRTAEMSKSDAVPILTAEQDLPAAKLGRNEL